MSEIKWLSPAIRSAALDPHARELGVLETNVLDLAELFPAAWRSAAGR